MNSKKLALFDIDGVIYQGNLVFDSIRDQEEKGIISGLWVKVLSDIEGYKSGRKNYREAADSMLQSYATAIKGISYKSFFDYSYSFISENKNKIFPYFAGMLPILKKKYNIYLVTTNFQFVAGAFAKYIGAKGYLSSVARVKDGKFTGDVELSLGGNKGMVKKLVAEYGKTGSIAVGDSENDADMLDKVEYPFVMEPNEKLKKIAHKNGWKIVSRDTISDIIMAHAR